MQRCFMVGCPRSGTTLLQSLVGAHSEIFTWRESHFFKCSFSSRKGKILRGLYSSRCLRKWLAVAELEKYIPEVPRFALTRKAVVDTFVRIWDDLACKSASKVWIEKTPDHIYIVDSIEQYVPEAQFIHVIRDGRAVVASLQDARMRYPAAKVWQRSLGDFVQMWNTAVAESTRHVGKANHFFVSYGALTANPRQELMAICQFLDLEYKEEVLENYRDTGAQIISPKWHWVKGVTHEIRATGLEKYMSVLSESERLYIEKNLIELPESLQKAMRHG